jgi:hypothetical protein
MLAGVALGLGGGVALALLLLRRAARSLAWPAMGIAIGSPCIGLPTLGCATVTGGLGDAALGNPVGPVVGVALGCFAGSFILSLASGGVGLLIRWIVCGSPNGAETGESAECERRLR